MAIRQAMKLLPLALAVGFSLALAGGCGDSGKGGPKVEGKGDQQLKERPAPGSPGGVGGTKGRGQPGAGAQ